MIIPAWYFLRITIHYKRFEYYTLILLVYCPEKCDNRCNAQLRKAQSHCVRKRFIFWNSFKAKTFYQVQKYRATIIFILNNERKARSYAYNCVCIYRITSSRNAKERGQWITRRNALFYRILYRTLFPVCCTAFITRNNVWYACVNYSRLVWLSPEQS